MHGLNEIVAMNARKPNALPDSGQKLHDEPTYAEELVNFVKLWEGHAESDVERFALEMAKRLLILKAAPNAWNDKPYYKYNG